MIVWVVSPSATERALIVAELAEEGFDARGFESVGELLTALEGGIDAEVLVVDSGVGDLNRLDSAKEIAPKARTILIANSMRGAANADHVLKRPLSIGELTEKIRALTGNSTSAPLEREDSC